ncbi:MAG: hypothetical protein WC663_03300 [Patescibacteria group bacterium]|jgi:hypothetical protein
MGLTIYYSGKIKDKKLIPDLQKKLIFLSKKKNWQYFLINENGYQGIVLELHPRAESFSIIFNQDGYIVDPGSVIYKENLVGKPEFGSFIKTQFAGVKTHLIVIKLLDYLKKNYLIKMDVEDEGEYWETRDTKLLQQRMDFLNMALDIVENKLKHSKIEQKGNLEEMGLEVEQILKSIDKKDIELARLLNEL